MPITASYDTPETGNNSLSTWALVTSSQQTVHLCELLRNQLFYHGIEYIVIINAKKLLLFTNLFLLY